MKSEVRDQEKLPLDPQNLDNKKCDHDLEKESPRSKNIHKIFKISID